ncbi:hypothetical protein ED733_008943 [Metarhizium rileyi]|uniref:Uncharacterized protein n=1 Tax=Metarhizium rileyi (strain RCEF 4871) TaxID=1649241 RepID=A0A5C6GNH6_METRR|nr:hypothetical protein ED733_008943 [Metarhizium rileyi]
MASQEVQDQGSGEIPGYSDQPMGNKPTESHALAAENAGINTSQDIRATDKAFPEDLDVEDVGWGERDFTSSLTVIPGVPNEQLATLIRRFDNQTFHVKAINVTPLANLDMNVAEKEEFSPEKLRAHLERLYTSVIVHLVAFGKQVAHIRSWSDWRRTFTFLSVYTAAWTADLLLSTMLLFLIVLILSPSARTTCFPPLSREIVRPTQSATGTKKSSTSTASGMVTVASEERSGEGAEREAHSFLNSIASLLLSTSAGKQDQDTGNVSHGKEAPDIKAPDVTQLQKDMVHAKDTSVNQDAVQQKTSKSVSTMVWKGAEETMHVVAQAVDNWERIANALRPIPPFQRARPRILLSLCVLLPLLASLFVTSYLLVKGLGLGIGIALFGGPVLSRVDAIIIQNYPKFRKYLELRNSVLRGVPTNAQLAVTLLRIGEHSKAPIPPPTPTNAALEQHTNGEQARGEEAAKPGQGAIAKQTKAKGGFLGFLRTMTGGGINVLLATDRVKAAVGERHAKNRLGVVEPPDTNPFVGPVRFPARYKGRKGYVYITTTATSPAVSWTSDLGNMNPAWTMSIAGIQEIQKVGGLGWKSKIMVHWALEKDVVDGLLLRSADEEYHLTAITRRDELFNRLVSAGPQMWEVL